MKYKSLENFMETIAHKDPGQTEFHQAVHEVMASIWPYIVANPLYADQALLDRLVEPERIIQFRISWIDDKREIHVNRGWRVQHSSAIGPFKGGMRFHKSVNLSVLKFLAFEQTFKNALTTLPLGGGKGGSDFDPKGKSDAEIMRFCQALVMELYRHLGPDTDVPAGDIGVGAREVGYMSGMVKKLTNSNAAYFTGKGISFGGSPRRPESTGYGTVYFVEKMLEHRKLSFEGMRVSISGSGNVAQYAAEKAMALGARVVTVSDSDGFAYDPDGMTFSKLALLQEIKNVRYGRVSDYAAELGIHYEAGKRPWGVPVDVALPCAVQNELDEQDAKILIKNGVLCVAEGANMPTTNGAIKAFHNSGVLFGPGKASNAGGVATSGLEMAQNAMRFSWPAEEVEQRLRTIMHSIHDKCIEYGTRPDGSVNYVNGANIAGFAKVADAMRRQGIT